MNKRNYFLSFVLILCVFGKLTGQNYCASKGNSPWQEWIANLQFGTINNTSSKEGYGNFTSQTTTVTKGTSYPLSITQGFSWAPDPTNATQQGKVWIDYNQNGIFEDAELAASFTRTTVTTNITIPTTALTGATRMRVSLKTTGAPTACETFEKGEVEDYTVNIKEGLTQTSNDTLRITSVVSPLTLTPNGDATLTLTIENAGNGANDPSKLFRLMTLGNIFGRRTTSYFFTGISKDAPIGVAIPARSTRTVNLTFKVNSDFTHKQPLRVANTPIYDGIHVGLSSISQLGSDGSNVIDTFPFRLVPQPTAVLQTGDLSLTTTTPTVSYTGNTIRYTLKVKNNSATPIPEVQVLTYGLQFLTTEGILMTSKGTTVINNQTDAVNFSILSSGYWNVGTLAAGEEATCQVQVSAAPFNADGSEWEFAAAVQSIRINETNSNNDATRVVARRSATTNLPDLTFSNINAPATARLNEPFSFNFRFKNNGNTAALTPFGSFGSVDLIKADGNFAATLVNINRVNGIPAGFDSLITYNNILPFFIESGNYTLRFNADPSNRIVESNENNNILEQQITILPATTDNSKLKITAATGPTSANPSATLPLSITIKNEGTAPSAPDSVFYATWRRVVFAGGYYPYDYALNRVGVPSIAAGASVTVSANFVLPATLRTTIVNNFKDIEPYLMLKSREMRANSSAPLNRDSFPKVSFYYPIQPAAQTDLSLTGSQLNTTWDSVNNLILVSLTLRNNGSTTAQNISVNINNTSVTNSIVFFNGTAIDSFAQLSGIGQVSRVFTDVNGGREENGTMFSLWKIPQLGAGASVTATFAGKAIGYQGVPQGISFYYKSLTVRPYILYADVLDANRSNDSVSLLTYNNIRYSPLTNLPDLTLANLTIPTPSVSQGNILNFNVDAKNIGAASATGNFNIKSYLSTDQILDASDYQNGLIPTANFTAGLTQTQVAGAMTVTNAVAAGNYYLILKIDGDNQIAESNENNNVIVSTATVTVTAVQEGNYCASKGIAPWEYWVANVGFGSINNASDKFKDFATLGYSDYTSLTTTVSKGQSYPLSISPGLSWIGNVPNAYVRAWIDFNDNKTFEANELVLEKTNANPLTANVLIPANAVTGNVRMRVALKFGAYPTACEAFDRGEVEDYTVNITGGTVTPTCLNKYFIYLSQPDANDCTGKFRYFGTIQGTVDFYGATFSDGFSFSITNDVSRARKTFQYAKTAPSATPPAGSKFRNCSPPNGWQYFVSNGIGRNERSDNFLDENVNVRVTYWGNPTKPDSIALELDSTSIFGVNNWATFKSDGFPPLQICNPCFKNDVTPPVITNCPTSEVIYNNTTVFAETILTIANISITDESCSNSTNSSGRQIQYSIPGVGSTPIFPPGVLTPLSLIAYDSAGNKSVCNFNLRVVLPNANQPDLTLANLTVPTPSVQQGQILNFKVDVKNIGTASATGNFNIKSYLSTDNILSANDYQDGTIPTANFAAGASNLQVAGAMTVSSAVLAGQYYLILKIDADNQITESNEGNNTIVGTGLITVTGGTTGGGADLALSITATPSVYRKFTTHAFRVTAQNIGSQALTNVKVELKRPALTSNGGSKVPSVGSFQDFCPGGIECSEWTIPTLAAGATATLDAPFFILDANVPIVVTTKLLSSTPTDAITANNIASVTVNPAPAPAPSFSALSRQKPTQYIPIVVQAVEPTLTDGIVTVRLESIVEKEVSFNIYNTMGKQVFSENRKIEKGENLLNFDVSELSQGLYLIAPSISGGRNAPAKFIKF